jgi:hypothetical protein
MAQNNYKIETLASGGAIAIWSNVTKDCFGNALVAPNRGDTQLHVSGFFDGAVVTFYGSNNPADLCTNPKDGGHFILRDKLTGKQITKSEFDADTERNGGAIAADKPAFIKFGVVGGTDKTNLTICVF